MDAFQGVFISAHWVTLSSSSLAEASLISELKTHSTALPGEEGDGSPPGEWKTSNLPFCLVYIKSAAFWPKPEFAIKVALVYTNVRRQSKHHHSLVHPWKKQSLSSPVRVQHSSRAAAI